MNETLKVLETRRSCRNFDKERMVSEEDIQAVVKAGTYAATGMGRQSPIIIAVTNKELRDRLSAENAKIMGTATDPFYGAPVILIVLADKDIPTYQYHGKSYECGGKPRSWQHLDSQGKRRVRVGLWKKDSCRSWH